MFYCKKVGDKLRQPLMKAPTLLFIAVFYKHTSEQPLIGILGKVVLEFAIKILKKTYEEVYF